MSVCERARVCGKRVGVSGDVRGETKGGRWWKVIDEAEVRVKGTVRSEVRGEGLELGV